MKSAGALLGVMMALAIGYFLLKAQLAPPGGKAVPPQQSIDVAGVQSDLLSIAQAERLYLASHNAYGTIEQLQEDGAISFSGTNRRGYNYIAEVDGGAHFKITATPSDPAKAGWPVLSVDETLQISQPGVSRD